MGPLHVGPREQHPDVLFHHVLEEDERVARLARDGSRHRDESRQHIGQLDAGEPRTAVVANNDREVHAEVRDERKRMAGVERQRCQHRMNVVVKVDPQIGTNPVGVLGALEKADVVVRQQWAQHRRPAGRHVFRHSVRTLADHRQLLGRVQAVG